MLTFLLLFVCVFLEASRDPTNLGSCIDLSPFPDTLTDEILLQFFDRYQIPGRQPFEWLEVDVRGCQISGETVEKIGVACGQIRRFFLTMNRVHSLVRLGQHCRSAVVYSSSGHNPDFSCDLVHFCAKPELIAEMKYEDIHELVMSNYQVDVRQLDEAIQYIWRFFRDVFLKKSRNPRLDTQLRGPKLIGYCGKGPWLLVCLEPRHISPDLYISYF